MQLWTPRRPSGKARGASIPGVCEQRATPPDGMHRRPECVSYSLTGPYAIGDAMTHRLRRPHRSARAHQRRGPGADAAGVGQPGRVHVGTEKPHATMMVYPDAELARTGDRAEVAVVPVAQRHVEVPRLAAPDATARSTSSGRLRRCRMADDPGALELADARLRHPDLHQHHLSLPAGPDGAAARAHTTSTRSASLPHARFTVPPAWKGRQVFLHFDGVDSAFYVWVNGTKVGYSEDSRTPAEFDITPHLQAGRRTCWRWRSTASATAPSSKTRTCGA